MRNLAFTSLVGAGCLVLAACGGAETDTADTANTANTANMSAAGETGVIESSDGNMGGAGAAAGASAGTASSFPKGARIVEENGVTYRIDADGSRVRLGQSDARIVTENGVRYRVDPGGTRVRINERGIDIDTPDLTPDVDLPDVDVGINDKGNPDIDVKNKKDGNDGPN